MNGLFVFGLIFLIIILSVYPRLKNDVNIIKSHMNYKLIFQEEFIDNKIDDNVWMIVPKGPSRWNEYMGGNPEVLENDSDGKFVRLKAVTSGNTYLTSGIKTKLAYGDGKFECEAKFKSGKSSWPAIWMTHPNGGQNNYEAYYEVDMSEYYETRDNTDVTYHCPESMRDPSRQYYKNVKAPIIINEWNKFVCTWDNNNIVVCINGNEALRLDNDSDSTHYPLTKENRSFQIILSMQYTNPYLSTPDISELPLYMDVRNIKIFEECEETQQSNSETVNANESQNVEKDSEENKKYFKIFLAVLILMALVGGIMMIV